MLSPSQRTKYKRGYRNPLSIFSSSTEHQVRSPHAGNILPIFKRRTLQGQIMIYSKTGCRGTLTLAVRGQAPLALTRQELLKEPVCCSSTPAQGCPLNRRGMRGPVHMELSLGAQPVIQTLLARSYFLLFIFLTCNFSGFDSKKKRGKKSTLEKGSCGDPLFVKSHG